LPDFRLGRRIAIDYGSARIGVASSSVDGLFANPLATVINDENALEEIRKHVLETEPIEIYVGLPLNLKGERTASTDSAIGFAKSLAVLISEPIRLVDERMSTRAAQGQIRHSGKNTQQSRSFIDAAAATLILEGALAFEKGSGRSPGISVTEF